jgi:RHS repeat-associated protein
MSYVYDEDGTLIADNLLGGATTTWGQSARYIYLPTASGPMPVAAIYGTKHYAIQSDHLNTPRRLIQSDGQVAWQWAYSAFGEEKPTIAKNRFANADLNQSFGSTTVPAVTFNLRYPGQYFDQESNLHYNYHRSYSSTTGRYTQADPIGLDGGWNRFGYVGQNPLSFTDSLGLASTSSNMSPVPGVQGAAELCFSDGCATEKQRCLALCSDARYDPDMRNIWGGSFRRCMNGCIPARCGGNVG